MQPTVLVAAPTATPTTTPSSTRTPVGGDGSMAVSPNSTQAGGLLQTFVFTYTAGTNAWTNGGQLRLDIDPNWPNAQDSDGFGTEGYTTVSFVGGSRQHGGLPGRVLDRHLSTAWRRQHWQDHRHLRRYLGQSPNGAVNAPGPVDTYTFNVSTDPQLDGARPIAVPPTINVVIGTFTNTPWLSSTSTAALRADTHWHGDAA